MSRSNSKPFNLDDFISGLDTETDRGCGVLGATILDEKLKRLFSQRLYNYQDKLQGYGGPLGSFSAKIDLACSLGWISDEAAKDLHTIRHIRNDFAHSFDHELSFQNQSVKDRCSNLASAQAFIDGFALAEVAPDQKLAISAVRAMRDAFTSARERYQITVGFLVQYLDDLPTDSCSYSGPDLLAECKAVSQNMRIQLKGKGIFVPPPEHRSTT